MSQQVQILNTNRQVATLALWQVSQAWHRGEGSMTIQHALQQLNNIKTASPRLAVRAQALIDEIVHKNVDRPAEKVAK